MPQIMGNLLNKAWWILHPKWTLWKSKQSLHKAQTCKPDEKVWNFWQIFSKPLGWEGSCWHVKMNSGLICWTSKDVVQSSSMWFCLQITKVSCFILSSQLRRWLQIRPKATKPYSKPPCRTIPLAIRFRSGIHAAFYCSLYHDRQHTLYVVWLLPTIPKLTLWRPPWRSWQIMWLQMTYIHV